MLARSNKFFWNLLMHRSAIHIWHGVMRNVPDLPPCPPDMSEPQYLALIYSRNCSVSLYLLVPGTRSHCLVAASCVARVGPGGWTKYFEFGCAVHAVMIGVYTTLTSNKAADRASSPVLYHTSLCLPPSEIWSTYHTVRHNVVSIKHIY